MDAFAASCVQPVVGKAGGFARIVSQAALIFLIEA